MLKLVNYLFVISYLLSLFHDAMCVSFLSPPFPKGAGRISKMFYLLRKIKFPFPPLWKGEIHSSYKLTFMNQFILRSTHGEMKIMLKSWKSRWVIMVFLRTRFHTTYFSRWLSVCHRWLEWFNTYDATLIPERNYK